jgi:hypothetical protein
MLVSTGLGGGPRRLEIDPLNWLAVVRALCLVVPMIWSMAAWAQPAGTAAKAFGQVAPKSLVLPSIQILAKQTGLAGACGGAAFNLNTFINVDSQASAEVHLSAPGFPNLETFVDETGSIGPFNGNYPTFTILSFGGGLPPNTPISIVINTYTAKALGGTVSYSSAILFDCTTGTVVSVAPTGPSGAFGIPTLGETALAAMTLLLMAAAFAALRRRPAARKPVHPTQRQR